jgi:hypothetical protein
VALDPQWDDQAVPSRFASNVTERRISGCRRVGVVALLLMFAVATASASTAGATAPTAAGNLAAAQQDASALLALFVAPPGASQVASEPAGDNGALVEFPAWPGNPNVVDQFEWFVVPGAAADVLGYAKSHPPAGSRYFESGGPAVGPNGPYGAASVGFEWPAIPGVLSVRSLVVSAIDLTGGEAGVRVDAQDIWITPRPAWERIPAGVRAVSIVVRAVFPDRPSAPVIVRSRARIRGLVALIDALPIEQPGLRHCGADNGPFFLLRFLRTGSSRPLAQLSTVDPCNGVSFQLGATEGPPLDGADQLVDAVNRLGAIPDCVASQLRPAGPSQRTGWPGTFTVRSVSRALCLLGGYPRLIVLDRHGARLPLRAVDGRVPVAERVPVDMMPGGEASFGVVWRFPDYQCRDPAASVAVRLPGRGTGSFAIPVFRPADLPWQWPCRGRITLEPFSSQP